MSASIGPKKHDVVLRPVGDPAKAEYQIIKK
jgi:hypothetical protein